MKIKGKKITGPNEEILVIPRSGEGAENIVFRARAVLDYTPFEKLCPAPKPPRSQRPGGQWFDNIEDPSYKKKMTERLVLEQDWLVIESLRATEGLEWETIDLAKPETYKNWRDELASAGFSPFEIGRIFQAVLKANCMHEETLQEARESFFLAHRQEHAG